MDVSEFLEGRSLTGRQAAIIAFLFLALIIAAALSLIIFRDFFLDLVTMVGSQVTR